MNTRLFALASLLSFAAVACGGSDPSAVDEQSALTDEASMIQAPREILDVSRAACASTHPLAGRDLPLTMRAHGVRGVVRIVDDCTLVISGFAYDGGGLQVELYGSVGGSFADGAVLSRDLLRRDRPYSGAQLIVRLPASVQLNALDGLSVWCSEAGASFADVSFR